MILLKISTKLFFNIKFSTISYQTRHVKTFFNIRFFSKMATKTLVFCTMVLVSIFSVLIIHILTIICRRNHLCSNYFHL